MNVCARTRARIMSMFAVCSQTYSVSLMLSYCYFIYVPKCLFSVNVHFDTLGSRCFFAKKIQSEEKLAAAQKDVNARVAEPPIDTPPRAHVTETATFVFAPTSTTAPAPTAAPASAVPPPAVGAAVKQIDSGTQREASSPSVASSPAPAAASSRIPRIAPQAAAVIGAAPVSTPAPAAAASSKRPPAKSPVRVEEEAEDLEEFETEDGCVSCNAPAYGLMVWRLWRRFASDVRACGVIVMRHWNYVQ